MIDVPSIIKYITKFAKFMAMVCYNLNQVIYSDVFIFCQLRFLT